MPKLTLITGQTAVGKTEFALQLAEKKGVPILNCDSLCFYLGMNIGTAKPTAEEQARVLHHGIDLVAAKESFSVKRYLAYVEPLLKEFQKRGSDLLVVGGSGFYLKSFFEPVADEIEVPTEVEVEVRRLWELGGLNAWVDRLKELNQGSALELDLKNPRRVERALLRCLSTGETFQALKERFLSLPKPYPGWGKELILLDRPSDEMRRRNHQRVELMLEAGLIEEVRGLREEGIEENPSAANAIGYRETLDFLDGKLNRNELAEQIEIHTNQLMRKQRAWFRHQLEPNHIVPASEALEQLERFC